VSIEAKDDGGGDDNWTTGAISRAKLQSDHHQSPPTNQHPVYKYKLFESRVGHQIRFV